LPRLPRVRRPSFLARARDEAPEGSTEPATPSLGQAHERSEWFWSHYNDAADATLRILAAAGVDVRGTRVADVGCGEGITDLALVLKGDLGELVGYDVNATDTSKLLDEARREGVADELPDTLRFELSQPTALPTADNAFDIVVSWSAFEHVDDPLGLMREIARVLRPDGVFMLQLWPFYHSEHGSHLWRWFPEGFAQFHSSAEIERRVREDDSDLEFAEMMLDEFTRLNRATLDDLGTAIRGAGMRVSRLEPISGAVNVPPRAADVPLSSLAISGVMLLAVHA
jgi:ubiquinone/menaquinone biosynthesis C-methylase UbiE